MEFIWISVIIALLFVGYLLYINHAMTYPPKEASELTGSRWTPAQVGEAYLKYKSEPTDFQKLLPKKTGRRYIVTGGSGLVGGWIVQHLLERGEDPEAIRILDIATPKRPIIVKSKVQYQKADVSDVVSVVEAFGKPWPSRHASEPLTVFHTAAYINPASRTADFLTKFTSVNEKGTRNVLATAKSAGCSVFIATSSAAVSYKRLGFFIWPWRKYPTNWFQFCDNAEPPDPNPKLDKYAGCYGYSKARAEILVRQADSKREGFRTGAIRPGHAIYGHGEESPMSLGYDYLRRGGTLTWTSNLVTQMVSAQNVSLAHLLFESKLSAPNAKRDIGGKAYAVTDPGAPFIWNDMYTALSTLAHKSTPIKFPRVPPLPFLLLAHLIESYVLIQHRYLSFLPEIKGDIAMVQPGTLHVSMVNLVYNIRKAQDELDYHPNLGTLEGLCLQANEWNSKIEAKLASGN